MGEVSVRTSRPTHKSEAGAANRSSLVSDETQTLATAIVSIIDK
jgi:hypothetical protein